MRNLFIDLHECRVGDELNRFGTGWENLFTDHLAFYLACDGAAANAVATTLMGGEVTRVKEIVPQLPTLDGRPDLCFRLTDGRHLLVENKIDASLQPKQLERYLQHGLVALVSKRSIPISTHCLNHEDYLRPEPREHFSWEDIFTAVPDPDEADPGLAFLRESFRRYMRELGFAPSNLSEKWRRLFENRTIEENRRVQQAFGKLLDGAAADVRAKYGLTVSSVSHKGRRVHAPDGADWLHVYLHPVYLPSDVVPGSLRGAFEPGYEALAIEVVYAEDQAHTAQKLFHSLPPGFDTSGGVHWDSIGTYPISRDRVRVSLATPLPPLFEANSGIERFVHDAASGALDLVLDRLMRRVE